GGWAPRPSSAIRRGRSNNQIRDGRRADTRRRAGAAHGVADTLSPMAASTDETVELLARVPVFETLAREALEQVAQVAVPRGFQPGEVVLRVGVVSDTCYVVRTGTALAPRE